MQLSPPISFDPLSGLQTVPSARPPDLGTVNFRVLSPFQRSLLVIDGTVTKFIEAFTLEPVEIIRLAQVSRQLRRDHRWLATPSGTSVIDREVLIRGKYSRNLHVYAVSLVVPNRLPEGVANSLETEGAGLGRLLNENGLETRREILWFGRRDLNRPPRAHPQLAGKEFFSRTYRIISGTQPVAFIEENFPADRDEAPSHH